MYRTGVQKKQSALVPLLGIAFAAACNHAATVEPDSGSAFDLGNDIAQPLWRERCNGVDDDGDGKVDEGCPIRLTNDPRNDQLPSLAGDLLVWNRFAYPLLPDLVTRDLKTLDAERVLSDKGVVPAASGSRACALGTDDAMPYLLIDLNSGGSTTFPGAPGIFNGERCTLGQEGRLMAWSQEGDNGAYLRDLSTGEVRPVVSTPAVRKYPRFDGNWLVWLDRGEHTDASYDVVAMDLGPGGTPKVIFPSDGKTYSGSVTSPPVVGGGRLLVIERPQDPDCALAVYDLGSGARTALVSPTGSGCPVPYAMSERFAVVEADPAGVSDLYLFDFIAGSWRQVTNYPRRSTDAAINKDWLVWRDDRDGNDELYMMDLRDYDAGDFFPEWGP